jgi:hypothetical protein
MTPKCVRVSEANKALTFDLAGEKLRYLSTLPLRLPVGRRGIEDMEVL